MGGLSRKINRRRVLTAAAGGAAAAVLTRREASAAPQSNQRGPNHLAWVWQFDEDGSPELIRWVLASNGLGIILKTHDGTDWMSRWDQSRTAINGPDHVRQWAGFFEAMGVPFHAWCVVEGRDPITEARMAAEVLSSGARSLTLDLEPKEGRNYWQTGSQEAIAFGQELRRLQPNAWISVAPDPRPWQLDEVPIAEFASFSNEIAPQTYWDTFDSRANYRLLRDRGVEVGPDGVTPELILDVTQGALRRFNLPVRPVGQGNADRDSWSRFVSHAFGLGMDSVSVWRYGTSNPDVWPLLQDMRPAAQIVVAPQRAVTYFSVPAVAGQIATPAAQPAPRIVLPPSPPPLSVAAPPRLSPASPADDKAAPRLTLNDAAAPGGAGMKQPWRWLGKVAGQ